MRLPRLYLLAAAASLFAFSAAAPLLRAQPFDTNGQGAGDAGHGTLNLDGTSSLTPGVTNSETNASPDSGDKSAAVGSPLTWKGVATGPAEPSDPEGATAIDGLNHDYFVLTVPAAASFKGTGKVITVTFTWLDPADDYDMFIHAGSETGPVIATSNNGAPENGQKTSFDPSANIDPATNAPYTVYYVNADYFDAPDAITATTNYTGAATVSAALVTTLATSYTHSGTITFSPNTPCKSPSAAQQGEPASRIDAAGHYYISGIEGVPAGVDLWYFDLVPGSPTYDPLMIKPQYRGMPDSLTNPPPGVSKGTLPTFNSGGVGGGDVDVAVGFGNYTGPLDVGPGENPLATPTPAPAVAMSSLTAANVTVFRSLDLGQTFTKNVAGNIAGGVPVNDRQWMQFIGNNDVYLEYRNLGAGVAFIQQSIDGGLNYNEPAVVGQIPQTGYIDVDQADGTVYVGGNDGSVSVGKPTSVGGLISTLTTFNKYQATASTTPANIFFCTRVAQHDVGAAEDSLSKAQRATLKKDKAKHLSKKKLEKELKTAGLVYTVNTVYAVYSDGKNVFLVYSLDQAQTWSNPVQVNDPSDTRENVNLLPWFAPGPTPGTVGVVWYGTDNATNADTAKWRVFYAFGTDANTDTPKFDITQASDHSIHAANISLNGLSVTGQSPNRNLIDYFQIQFDPVGAAIIGYTDDHNDFQGFTYVTRQQTGASALNTTLTPATPGSSLTAEAATQPAQPGPNGEQVTDYAQDQSDGLVGGTPSNSPVDIVSVKYQSQDVGAGPVIIATTTVSQLNAVSVSGVSAGGIPVDSTWMMFFTANAPEVGNVIGSPGNKYSTGLSDRGDQFFIEAVTGTTGATTYSWGSVVRNFDGSTTDTVQGTADSGAFDRATNTVSVRVSASKLNTFLDTELAANGPDPENPARYTHLASGTVLCGLRGLAFEENTTGGDAIEDATRGGTEYKIP